MECTIASRNPDHDGLRFALMSAGLRMADAAEQPGGFSQAHAEVVRFCVDELLPHLDRDERWLADMADCPEGGLLAEAMRAEARMMAAAVHELSTATEPGDAVAVVRVLHAFLAAHDHHETLLGPLPRRGERRRHPADVLSASRPHNRRTYAADDLPIAAACAAGARMPPTESPSAATSPVCPAGMGRTTDT